MPSAFSRCSRHGAAALRTLLLAASACAALPSLASATPPPNCGLDTPLVNGSFESPTFPAYFQIYYTGGVAQPADPGSFGWATTASDNQIELWASKNNPSAFRTGDYLEFGATADSGEQFAELNGNERATLYQDRPTVPGSTLRWSLAHRGRDADETMRVAMGAPSGSLDAQTPDGASGTAITDGITSWGKYTGTYEVPAGQYVTRFAFESVVPAVGGQGNLVDSVVLDVSANACNDSAATVTGQPVFIDAIANDGGHQITLGQPGAAAHGTVTRVGGQYRYVPVAGFTGTDTFDYSITDSFGTTATGTVTVTTTGPVGPAPDAPALDSSDEETVEQRVTIFNPNTMYVPRLLDADGVPRLTVAVRGVGTYVMNVGKGGITFTPEATFIGVAPIQYQLQGEDGQVAAGTYTPTVNPTPRVSTGEGDFVQTAELNFAPGDSIGFLTPGGQVVPQLTVPGIGRYSVSSTGTGTFEPAAGYVGTAPAQAFRLTDPSERHADNTWTPTVTATSQASLSIGDKYSSESPGTQTAGGFYPDWSHFTVKLTFGSSGQDELTVPGVGRFHIEPGSWRLQFTPVEGFFGTYEMPFTVTGSHGYSASATYAATVESGDFGEGGEAPPADGVDVTSTGIGTAVQYSAIDVPAGGTAQFLGGTNIGSPAFKTWTDPGKGTYTVNGSTLEFRPVLGYVGTPDPIVYQIIDAGRHRSLATYTPTVTKPAPPAPADETTTGAPASTQATTVPVPSGGSIALLSAEGALTTEVRITGEGAYTLDPATGTITFSAEAGFSGRSAGVRFQVTDAYGQVATGAYAATVTTIAPTPAGAAPTPTAPPMITAPAVAPPASACVSKRKFQIHWRVPGKQKITSITLALTGGKPVKLSGTARRATVDLRGRAKSRVVLTLTARMAKGGTLTATRDYHPCTAEKPGDVKTLKLVAPSRR